MMPDWPEIVSREGPAVWRLAYRLLGNRADADECLQETFLAALAVARREDVRNWRGLLMRLAVTRSMDRLRERVRRGETGHVEDWSELAVVGPSPSQSAEDAELAGRLRDALAQIPAQQAEVFCLRCLEARSYQEIAGDLSISVDAVGVLLHRARKRLRDLLGGLLNDGRSARAGILLPGEEVP
jgi:RNA polymerase sigma-70 factor, ECF subfamily